MPVEPFHQSALGIDLSPRFAQSSAVAGSPAAASITNVCTLTFPNFATVAIATGVQLEGWVAFTVGTSGTAAKLDIRQTGTSGAVIATTGALTVTAGNLVSFAVQGIDTSPLAPGVWILALTITAGAATSTVSATQLQAQAV